MVVEAAAGVFTSVASAVVLEGAVVEGAEEADSVVGGAAAGSAGAAAGSAGAGTGGGAGLLSAAAGFPLGCGRVIRNGL